MLQLRTNKSREAALKEDFESCEEGEDEADQEMLIDNDVNESDEPGSPLHIL